MANDVYANGREIACKAADGKSICCFPDVCMTPPENPATPPGVPVPYPNTGMASDTTDGSTTVQISGKETMLKNKSFFKKSIGDEAGCAAKKGVVTNVNRGKIYFISWSMDVKSEGENVVRHFDQTTHNHASPATNTGPWPYQDNMTAGTIAKCSDTYQKYQLHKHGKKGRRCRGNRQQSNHPVMNACFEHERAGQAYGRTPRYKCRRAPAICVTDSRKGSPHYKITQDQVAWAKGLNRNPTYRELRAQEKKGLKEHMGMTEDEAECVMKAVDAYMETIGVDGDTVLRVPAV